MEDILEFICIECEEMWDEVHLDGVGDKVCGLCGLPLFQRIDGCRLPTPVHFITNNATA